MFYNKERHSYIHTTFTKHNARNSQCAQCVNIVKQLNNIYNQILIIFISRDYNHNSHGPKIGYPSDH